MNKTYNKVLDNGLKVYIVENKKKNRCGAKIVINAGGHNFNYIDKKGNKRILKKGIAHFLEHYLIEKSIYGNLGKYFADESMSFNGVTFNNRTEFYFSTVHGFKDALVRLIRLVNQPNFNEIDIEEVKKPIIEEIKRSIDNKYRQENKKIDKAFFSKFPGDINLGDIETIENLTIEDLKEFHNCFYSTNNQVLSIYSKYDVKEVLKIINQEYSDNKKDVKIEKIIEPVQVRKKELTIVDPKEDEYLRIRFKIKLDGYSSEDVFLLENYMYYLTRTNFSVDSKLFKKLRDNNYTIYAIDTYFEYLKNYKLLIFEVLVYTSEFDKVKEMILDTLNNIDYDEERFELIKNNLIISFINKQEQVGFQNNSWLENYTIYGLDYLDDIDDIKKENIKEMKEVLEKIDFTNYLVIKRVKKEDNV